VTVVQEVIQGYRNWYQSKARVRDFLFNARGYVAYLFYCLKVTYVR